MRVVVFLVVLLGIGWWYFEGGRQLSEEKVRGYYDTRAQLFEEFNAEELCSMLAEDYQADDLAQLDGKTEHVSVDKDEACESMTDAIRVLERLDRMSAGILRLESRLVIDSISLSSDEKTATVKVVHTMMIGERLLARTRGTEELIRRNGKVLSAGGETRSWLYQ